MQKKHNPQELPLRFERVRRKNLSGRHLALAFGRDTTHDTPDLPPQPEVPIAPRKAVVGMDYAASYSATGGMATCRTWFDFARPLAWTFAVHDVDVIEISGCLNVKSVDLARLDKSFAANLDQSASQFIRIGAARRLYRQPDRIFRQPERTMRGQETPASDTDEASQDTISETQEDGTMPKPMPLSRFKQADKENHQK